MLQQFLTKDELNSVVTDYQIGGLGVDDDTVDKAILAAISEATSYLNAHYNCTKIFATTGNDRNILVLEHCKSLAMWYILRISNADILFDRIKEYYNNAVEWFKMVAQQKIVPDLPLKESADGGTQIRMRSGSLPKFSHNFD